MKNSSLVLIVSVMVGILFIFSAVLFLKPDPEPVTLPVLVEEFSDFQCPACQLYSHVKGELENEFGEDVNFVYKHFPLVTIHDRAYFAAVASEAAREQGKFQEFHDMIFADQDNMEDEDFFSYAQELEMDVDKFKEDYNNNEVLKERVDAEAKEAVDRGATGTPTFFINGDQYNAVSPDGLISKVRELVERGRAEAVVESTQE